MVLFPILGGLLALAYSRNQDIVYEATATLLVKQTRGGFSPGTNDFRESQQLASTYRRLVTTTPFLETVIERNESPLGVGQLARALNATTDSDPPVIEISIRHGDSVVAADTANMVAEAFIDYVIEQRLAEIARLQSAAAAQGILNIQELVSAQFSAVDSLSLLEPVAPPGSPILPRTRQNVIIGVMIGILLASAVAIFLESLGDTVRSPDDITRRLSTTVLGSVFRWSSQDADEEELVLWKSPSSTFAESFRQIRANLQFATANKPGNVYLFCSPGPGEGKSTITSNIAIALAQTGKQVVVIDGDLRRATVHRRFESIRREPGLSNYLADFTTDLDSVIHRTKIEGVSVIPSGPTPPNPAELLGSPKMNSTLEQLKGRFDYVLIDSAPILLVADGSILASQANGAVVVVDGSRTRMSSLHLTLNTLRNTQVEILGVVINKLKRARFGYGYGYSYQYYYANYGYYGTSEGEESLNGHKKIYQLPAHWAKTIVSRGRSGKEV